MYIFGETRKIVNFVINYLIWIFLCRKSSMAPRVIKFKDYPDFKPNLTPRDIFLSGSFGGSYWRKIYSRVCNRTFKNQHKKFSFLEDVPIELLVGNNVEYGSRKVNKYKVKASDSLRYWESKGWISKSDPYGWVQWYCNFYAGRRIPTEDKRQIKRWKQTAGEKSRFRLRLINEAKRRGVSKSDPTLYPRMRQTLQHWGVSV